MNPTLVRNRCSRGFSLIELMVAMAIGLIVTLAITRVMIATDDSKRRSTSTNDTVQAGMYSSFILERAIRQAGTGYTQRLNELFGCRINASKTSNTPGGPRLLPATAPFPAPFTNAALDRRLAPVLIEQDAANSGSEVRGDVISVLSGAGGKSELPLRAMSFSPAIPPHFSIQFAGEYVPGSLVLVGGDRTDATGNPIRDCMVQQVQTVASRQLVLGGDYFSMTGGTVNFSDFPSMSLAHAAQLGVIGPTPEQSNLPLFQMFAVGDDATIFSYDLLRTGATETANAPQPVSDSVVEMRALYGVDTDLDRVHNGWQDPGAAPFRYADLTDGSSGALQRLKQINSIRLGLIVRSPLQEKEEVAPTELVLFRGLTSASGGSLERTRTLSADERVYRYRVLETVIPLRNMKFAPLP
jgi:type IV pilus assembly protein PilW